jgi:hypothetical protein
MPHPRSVAFALLGLAIVSGTLAQSSYIPAAGFVPNADVAIAIARAVSVPIYGAEKIHSEEPLVAEPEGDAWLVHGTLQCSAGPDECIGGTVEVTIMRQDGRIVRIIHTQ